MFQLLEKSFHLFASSAGQEFLLILSAMPTLSRFDKNLKHLLLAHKKKDASYQTKEKSPFYTVVLKVLRKASKLDSFQALDLLSTTAADITNKDPE